MLNSLDAAVPWFFVLSAFLLFEPIARSAIDSGPVITARGFLVRRAVRLLPVYYVAVIVVWFLRQQSLPGDWRDLLEHLSFTQVFDAKRIFFTNGPAWSLSVSVYFYLALTVLGVILVRRCRSIESRSWRVALLATATALLGVISLGVEGLVLWRRTSSHRRFLHHLVRSARQFRQFRYRHGSRAHVRRLTRQPTAERPRSHGATPMRREHPGVRFRHPPGRHLAGRLLHH